MEEFFKKQTQSSRIKANIVAEYFPQYCKIILKRPQNQIRYLDLFAGPGLYEDSTLSTPLLIADHVAKDSLLSEKVQLLFNDMKYSEQLRKNFYDRFNKDQFKHEPRFGNKTVGEYTPITDYLTKEVITPNPHPTLLFFDPWGYKGIDTLVLSKFMENWGNEIFLFVNIKRIHAAIENNKFDSLMKSLFPTSLNLIKKNRRYKASVYERLSLIMDNLAGEFKNSIKGQLYHTAFKFQEEDSRTTSHYILHLTKHIKGYELCKQVYYDFDNLGASLDKYGNYCFDAKLMDGSSELNLDFSDQNIEVLSRELQNEYKGQTVSAKQVFDEYHPKTKYCGSHFVKTLRFMVENDMVKSKYTDGKDHKVSVLLNDHCKLQFS